MTLDHLRELAVRLTGIPAPARAAIRREWCDLHGIHPATLSRALAEIGYRERAPRRDRGVRRAAVSQDQVLGVAAIRRASNSLRKGDIMPTADAVEIARDSGLLGVDVSTSTVNRWLRESGLSADQQKQPTPHVDLRSLGPNHVHQADFSLAVNWKCFQGALKYEHLVYKNKPPMVGEPRLWRMIVTDHATGAFGVRYIQATGETVQATLEGLYHSWAAKPDSKKYPFRGLPRILMMDRGSANQTKITASVMERLQVALHICEGARSKGSVEVSHRFWEEHFESRLRLQPPESVGQLNQWALDFGAKLNSIPEHSRYGATRSAMWTWYIGRREETTLRELRCSWEEFTAIALSEPHRALVSGNRVIRFKGKRYRVPETAEINSTVLVQYSPFDLPAILVRPADTPNAPAWLCEPVELDEFGFLAASPVIGVEYKSHAQTKEQKAGKDAAAKLEEYLPTAPKLRVFGHHADRVDTAQQPQPRGEAVDIAPAAEVRYTRLQARTRIVDALGRTLAPYEAAEVNRMLGDTATAAEIDALVERIAAGVSAPKLVAIS